MATTDTRRSGRRSLLRLMTVTAFVLATAFLLWPRSTPECSTYGRAADYQSMPATIGTGVTCVR